LSLQRCQECYNNPMSLSSTCQGESATAVTRRLVLLVTNARSGSSFSSALIAAHPQVFYYFEPLFPLMKLQMDPHGTDIHIDGHYTFENTVPIIEDYFTCAPKNISLFDHMLQLNSGDTNTTQRCIMNDTKTGHEHLACYFDEVNNCLSHKITLMKLVRFRVKWSRYFLNKYPTAKILFLIRDPRAILYSQGKYLKHFNWTHGSGQYAERFCNVMREDVEDYRQLSLDFPGRIKAIRYEDGAINPKAYARSVYKFLGIPYTQVVDQYITSLAYPSQSYLKKERPFNVYRADATATMNHWRHVGGWGPNSAVDAQCKDLFPSLGYRSILSEEHMLSNASVVEEADHSLGVL